MIKECIICGKLFDTRANAKTCSKDCSKACSRERKREYDHRPEVKERKREYAKDYRQRPETKKRERLRMRNLKSSKAMAQLQQALTKLQETTSELD